MAVAPELFKTSPPAGWDLDDLLYFDAQGSLLEDINLITAGESDYTELALLVSDKGNVGSGTIQSQNTQVGNLAYSTAGVQNINRGSNGFTLSANPGEAWAWSRA